MYSIYIYLKYIYIHLIYINIFNIYIHICILYLYILKIYKHIFNPTRTILQDHLKVYLPTLEHVVFFSFFSHPRLVDLQH